LSGCAFEEQRYGEPIWDTGHWEHEGAGTPPIDSKTGAIGAFRLRVPPQWHHQSFIFLDADRPWRKVKDTDRCIAEDFAGCMRELCDVLFPKAKKIRVVLDDLSTHSASALYQLSLRLRRDASCAGSILITP